MVDDSVTIREALELLLAKLKRITAIHFADCGENALEKAGATPYDLVFLDAIMPGMDGYETCAKMRGLPGYNKTPIIMVSGNNSPLAEARGIVAGCTSCLKSPFKRRTQKACQSNFGMVASAINPGIFPLPA